MQWYVSTGHCIGGSWCSYELRCTIGKLYHHSEPFRCHSPYLRLESTRRVAEIALGQYRTLHRCAY
eukprot:3282425-Rhodomonas_salina.1